MKSKTDQKIMIIDTEYDTNPKRMLALSYLICKNDIVQEKIKYVKYSPDVFKVDENGEAFKYHKLTNKFLEKEGVSINSIMTEFEKDLEGIEMIIGQNIISADINIIRKESIGTFSWYESLRDKLKNIPIYDTMISFRDKNPGERSSLDNIYKYLFNEEMENHHNALDDCKNTLKCYQKMVENNYNFERQIFKFNEDTIDELMKPLKKCDMCEAKIPEGNNIYKFINKFNLLAIEGKQYSICNNKLKENQIICKKCYGNLELLILNDKNDMINLVKLKNYDSYSKDFFEVEGDEATTIYLKSQYKDKEEIKKLGGKWDSRKKSWYFSYTIKTKSKLNDFSKWIEKNEIV
jgi:DNA polymerase III epsilon subunit-like protein